MQELRLVERRENSLILSTKMGQEFALELNEENTQLLREALRPRGKSKPKLKPREIQGLLRSGKATEEVAEELGLDVLDIERYEKPIMAERAYILKSAHAVEVRTAEHDGDDPQLFGAVINERINQFAKQKPAWKVWKTEAEWMVQVEFTSDGINRTAIWAFDHKKNLLNAINAEAVNLSKQGDIGEKLIPTLRALDKPDPAEDVAEHETQEQIDNVTETANSTEDTPSDPVQIDDYTRRLNIEERAIQKDQTQAELQSDTADLLEALREKRTSRQQETPEDQTLLLGGVQSSDFAVGTEHHNAVMDDETVMSGDAEPQDDTELISEAPKAKNRKNRPAVPSWEEILFGQKSDNDTD